METYKKKLIKRQIVLSTIICFIAIVVFLDQFSSLGDQLTVSDFIQGFQYGLIIAVEIIFVQDIIKIRKALSDESMLNDLYIQKTDERKILIQKEIGIFSFNIILSVLAIATIVAGYFNTTVFFTLFGVLVFVAFTKGFAKIYFNRKY